MEPRPILVAVAWPYANGLQHLGHIGGAYLPADIFARYHRARGNDVLMVSGSDAHGTPITVRADQEGVDPIDIVNRYHPEFLRQWDTLGISFDLFTTTMTENHHDVTRSIFNRLRERGYIDLRTTEQMYDPEAERFLPDRYVEGTCPHCGYPRARGDQCENCGRTLDPIDLINPVSRVSGATPVLRETEHFFLLLSKLEPELLAWLESREGWRRHVINWSLQFVKDGLHDRAITRDLTWGVRLPDDELGEGKRIYVWFDAVIGYLSASIEWAQRSGDPEAWRRWWEGPEPESYYFVGKDNIPFHTVIWPAILLGHGDLDLPTNVPANQYVTFKGEKASKSAGVGRSVLEYLEVVQPDALRYALASVLPEQNDTELTDDEIVRRVNDELVAVWGNLVNRVLSMIGRNFDGVVPEPADPQAADTELVATVDRALDEVAASIEAVELRAALRAAMSAAQAANAYLSDNEPWKVVKNDPARAGTVLHHALQAVAGVNVALSPYIPFASASVAEALGVPSGEGWARTEIPAGRRLGALAPLFSKLDSPLFGDDT
ncbi:MAG: methionine--tRNA ligase [Acidimicrobiia bacterium]|nr:methionine--tRNA ligase [Acidimicrobiia bacterium]